MIPTRSAAFEDSPPPPPWLDPKLLGATTIIAVPRERVCVIEGGREGLLEYLRANNRLRDSSGPSLSRWEAYVVIREDGSGVHVFSSGQFWIAHILSNLAEREEDWPYEGMRILNRVLDLSPETFGEIERYMKGMRWEISDGSIAESLSYFFHIREYSAVEELTPGRIPDWPAVERDALGNISKVYVPDTTHLFRGLPWSIGSYSMADGGALFAAAPICSEDITVSRYVTKPLWRRLLSRVKTAIGGMWGKASDTLMQHGMFRQIDRISMSNDSGVPMDDEVLQRTPHMNVSREEPLQPGEKFQISVFADMGEAAPGEVIEPFVVRASRSVRSFEVSVWVVATSHFEIGQPVMKPLTLEREVSVSSEITFDVEVRRDVTDAAPPEITAIFFYQSRACGSVSRQLKLEGSSSEAEGSAEKPPRLQPDESARPADLNLVIAIKGRAFNFWLQSPLVEKYRLGETMTWEPEGTTEKLVHEQFKLFTTPDLPKKQRIANLRGAGRELFKAAPQLFQDAFWEIIDSGAPLRTISIVTSEPFTPWELMIPHRRLRNGVKEQRPPLGVEFAVGRWICQDFALPGQVVPLSSSWVFAPRYKEGGRPKPLLCAPEEAKFVCDHFAGTLITPAEFDGIELAMAKGGRSLFHLICHGSAPTGGAAQSIYCEDSTPLNSVALAGTEHLSRAMEDSRPFVFLNACEVGRTTPALVGVGGFAAAFIDLQASCVIAPLWSVKDTKAAQVARAFYEATLAEPDKPFAEIMSTIRKRAYDSDDAEDSYAAYCFYGDPLAAQERGERKAKPR